MEVKRGRKPPDGGWGWMVIGGCFVILMTMSMVSFGYSILFSDFLLSRGASSTTIAWIFNIHFFLWNAIGVFTGPLTAEFGFRRISLVGCGLAAVSAFALAFVDSLWGLFVFFSFVGMFGGLGAKPCYLLLTRYFDRKRGRANAFLMAGVCIAQFIGPPLIRHFLVEYGRTGATLMLCGMVLQSIIGASLFQPVEWHMKVEVEEVDVDDEKKEEKVHDGDADAGVTEEMRVKEAERRKMLGVNISRRPSEISMLSLAVSNIDLSTLTPVSCHGSSVFENTTDNKNLDNTSNKPSECMRGFLKATARVLKAVISNMKILRSPRALIIIFGGVLSLNAYINFVMMVPFALQSAGHSLSDAAWCISLGALANLVVRLISSALSDHSWFSLRFAYMAGCTIVSLTTIGFGFLQNLRYIQVVMVLWGCGVALNTSLLVLLMYQFMGADKMSAIFSVNSLMLSISVIIFGPSFGFIRDASDSYVASMIAMGCCAGLCMLLWCFMPAAIAYDERKEAEQMRKEERREGLAEKV